MPVGPRASPEIGHPPVVTVGGRVQNGDIQTGNTLELRGGGFGLRCE